MSTRIVVKRLLVLFVIILLIVDIFQAQDPSRNGICGMVGTPFLSQRKPNASSGTHLLQVMHYGGKYITSSGTLRVLAVFVRFSGDVETSSTWPDPNVLPPWAQNIVDTSYSGSGNYTQNRMSKFFYENSYGAFHVIGDVYYITTDHNEDYYHQYANTYGASEARGVIETEVFNKLAAAPFNVDFTRYDNWHSNSEGNAWTNAPGADGILDMCWILTRNLHDENYGSAYQFGIGWAVLDCPSVTKSGVVIIGDTYFPGSGIGGFQKTLAMPLSTIEATSGDYTVVSFMAHEMSHYLYGSGHFATLEGLVALSSTRGISSMKGYAGGWQGHYSGYEKWRLGWLSPTIVSTNTDSVLLYDQATTTEGSRNRLLEIPIDASQFFLVENRHWISNFESRYAHLGGPANARLKPGLVIYHIVSESDDLPSTQVKMLSAEGKFVWTTTYYANTPYYAYDDVVDKATSDAVNGYDKREFVYASGRSESWGNGWRIGWWPDQGAPYGGGVYRYCVNMLDLNHPARDFDGDSLNVFGVGDVVSPWSNPASHKWSGTAFVATTIGIQVISFDPSSQSYALAVRLTGPEQLAPSRPQSVSATYNSNHQSVITWAANLESDVTGYDIYRAIYYDGLTPSYTKINTSLLTSPSYVDNPDVPGGIPAGKDVYWRYYVQAKDNQNKYSVRSEDAWLYVGKTVSGTISANTLWDRNRIVVGDVTVNSGATLQLSAGVTVRFMPYTAAIVYGQLIANGSSSSPIAFLRGVSSQFWTMVFLQSVNNQLSYCLFDGGYYGVVVYGGTCQMTNCTIRNCTSIGLYVHDASVGSYSPNWLFSGNYIHDNGTGIYIEYLGSVYLLGTNKVVNNASSQIYLESTTSSRLYGQDGYNAIYSDNTQSPPYDIYNSALSYDGENYMAWTVPATQNYWGDASGPVVFEAFFGPVSYDPYLTYDPTDVSGNPSVRGEKGPLTITMFPTTILSAGMAQAITKGDTSGDDQRLVDVKARMLKLRGTINNSPYEIHTASRLNELYSLLSFDPTDKLGEKALVLAILAKYRGELTQLHASQKQVEKALQLAGEMGMVLEVQEQVKNKSYSDALQLAATYEPYIQNLDSRHELLSNRLATYEQTGEYAKGLAVIDELEKLSKQAKPFKGRILPDYSNVKQRLLDHLGMQLGQSPGSGEAAMQLTTFGLGQNYPNPFNPSTTIPFRVKDATHVKITVYDMLGRRIAELANGMYGAGEHHVVFGGNQIASGTYIVRAEMSPLNGETPQKFQQKIVFLK